MLLTKKDAFLKNKENKTNFIALLMKKMEEQNIKTARAIGDADMLICNTGIEIYGQPTYW